MLAVIICTFFVIAVYYAGYVTGVDRGLDIAKKSRRFSLNKNMVLLEHLKK